MLRTKYLRKFTTQRRFCIVTVNNVHVLSANGYTSFCPYSTQSIKAQVHWTNIEWTHISWIKTSDGTRRHFRKRTKINPVAGRGEHDGRECHKNKISECVRNGRWKEEKRLLAEKLPGMCHFEGSLNVQASIKKAEICDFENRWLSLRLSLIRDAWVHRNISKTASHWFVYCTTSCILPVPTHCRVQSILPIHKSSRQSV